MVRRTWSFCCLAQPGRLPPQKNASSLFGRRNGYSFGLVMAKTGFHNARSTFQSHVWVFPDARRSEARILDSDLPFQSGVDLLVYLFRRSTRVSLACGLPRAVGLHYSVVGHCISDFFVALDVPRRARKCLDIYLTKPLNYVASGPPSYAPLAKTASPAPHNAGRYIRDFMWPTT